MRVGVRGKLLGSFGLILGMLALIGTLGLYQLGLAMRALHDVADDEVVGLTAVFESRAASLSLQRDLRALVLAFTPEEKQKLKASQDEAMSDRVGTVRGLREQACDTARAMAALVQEAIDAEATGSP